MLKRTGLSRGNKPLKRVAFKKKRKSQEDIASDRKELEEMRNVFLSIWDERRGNDGVVRSEISGTSLGAEPLTTLFHHIYPKSKYPEYKLHKDNIILLTFEEHQKAENDVHYYEEIEKRRIYFDRHFIENNNNMELPQRHNEIEDREREIDLTMLKNESIGWMTYRDAMLQRQITEDFNRRMFHQLWYGNTRREDEETELNDDGIFK